MKARYLASIRLLVQCYQAFEKMSDSRLRSVGLTPSQFDVIATLGNTQGMSLGELGEKTLITKGTLTGVIDRLEEKGLIKRQCCQEDRRSTIVQLTSLGEQAFIRTFQAHVQFCKRPFDAYSEADFTALDTELTKLRAHLEESVVTVKK